MNEQENLLTNDEDTVNSKKSSKKSRGKKKRVPIFEQHRILSFPMDPNYVYRLANDDNDGRIQQLLEAGYEIVDKNGKEIDVDVRTQDGSFRSSALCQPVGGGMIGYVMRIPKEDYEDDRKKEAAIIKMRERAIIKHVPVDSIEAKKTNFYGDVTIEHERNPL